MMDQIFQDYVDKIIDGEDKLKDAFATYSNTSVKWIKCEDITVAGLVDQICDDFESAGFDLDDLPIDNIKERFIDFKPEVKIPQEYIELDEAKRYVEQQMLQLKSNENFQGHPRFAEAEADLSSTLETIIAKLEELV